MSQGGNPVPNGTAVEFHATDPGTFTDTTTNATIRTTTNGVATTTLTSSSAGNVTVTAIVNNASKTVTVAFGAQSTTPPPSSTTPSITAISPTTGDPAGGTIVTITGTNFAAPVRAFFDLGGGVTKEAFVASVTPTQVQVISPKIDLGSGQSLAATIRLINQAGTASEASVTAGTQFTYALASLTPSITTVSPTSGPIEGGTRITIFGSGFQAPVQVSFGSAPGVQLQVITVTFSQIIAVTPAARDVNPDGSGPFTGPVNLTVLNINSNKSVSLSGAFRYTPKMQITTVGPNEGPFDRQTRFTIDGIGFDDPLAVTTATVAATVVKVSGTEVIALANPVQPSGCSDVTGPIVVTNTNNGDSATGPQWIYRIPKPTIIHVDSPVAAGATFTITVKGAFGTPRIKIGTTAVNITGQTLSADGTTTTFTAVVPTTLQLQTQACSGASGVTTPIPTAFDVSYTSAETSCTDTLTNGIVVNPPVAANIAFSPAGFTPFSATFVAGNPAAVPPTTDSVTPSAPQNVAIVNNGTAALTINSVTTNGAAGCSQFQFAFPATPQVLNQCDLALITAIYVGPTPPAKGSGTCSVVVNTSAGTKTLSLLGITQ